MYHLIDYVWTVENFSRYLDKHEQEVYPLLTSPIFSYKNTRWVLNLYPEGLGDSASQSYISLFIKYVSEDPETINAKVELSLLNNKNERVYCRDTGDHQYQTFIDFGYKQFLKIQDIKDQKDELLLKENLKIFARVEFEHANLPLSLTWSNYDLLLLKENLKDLYETKLLCDILIKIVKKQPSSTSSLPSSTTTSTTTTTTTNRMNNNNNSLVLPSSSSSPSLSSLTFHNNNHHHHTYSSSGSSSSSSSGSSSSSNYLKAKRFKSSNHITNSQYSSNDHLSQSSSSSCSSSLNNDCNNLYLTTSSPSSSTDLLNDISAYDNNNNTSFGSYNNNSTNTNTNNTNNTFSSSSSSSSISTVNQTTKLFNLNILSQSCDIKAHKFILASRSGKFRELLKTNLIKLSSLQLSSTPFNHQLSSNNNNNNNNNNSYYSKTPAQNTNKRIKLCSNNDNMTSNATSSTSYSASSTSSSSTPSSSSYSASSSTASSSSAACSCSSSSTPSSSSSSTFASSSYPTSNSGSNNDSFSDDNSLTTTFIKEQLSITDDPYITDLLIIETNHNPLVVDYLIRYIYTGYLDSLDSYAKEVYEISKEYKVHGLTNLAREHIIKELDVSNCCDYLVFCVINNDYELNNKIQTFITENVEDIIRTHAYKQAKRKYRELFENTFNDIMKKMPTFTKVHI